MKTADLPAGRTLKQIAVEVRRAAGKRRLVFVSGNFNVVHPGHLRLLRFACECGDFLVVGVNMKETEGALLSEQDRLEGVRSIGFIDYAFLLSEAPERFIKMLRPDFVVKGSEHEGRFNAELPVLSAYGGRLLFGSGETSFSSIDLLKREFSELNHLSIVKPKDYLERHGFALGDLRVVLERFRGMRVVVVGDLIVDEYVDCEPLGMSQEEPALVVSPIGRERFIGGSAIAAAHARSLGGDVEYFSIAGKDEARDFSLGELERHGVRASVFVDESRPTTLKQRFRAAGRSLLRVSHLRQHGIGNELTAAIFERMRQVLKNADLLIFSDFNYGCLPQTLVDALVKDASARGLPIVADSQSSSQIGDVSRFRNALLITPTEREARLAARDFTSGLVVLAEALHEKSGAANITITLGSEGVLVHTRAPAPGELVTDRLPALNTAPKDVAGGGDSFLVCASMALVAGAGIWRSAFLGSLAAACQVSRVGNIPLRPADLLAELDIA